jgi:YD repeat-containing protein
MKTLRQCATGGISPFFPLLLLLILFFNNANAQLALINEFTPPSAQASQFTKYGKYNPQLYTGTLSLSIPIYTYKDKDFEIPVSLDYSYNGLIANKQASEIGMGWSLGCGGYVTREVRGIPDEEIGTIVWTESRVQETLYGFDLVPFDNADSLGTLYTTPFSELTNSVDVLKTFYTYNRTNYESSPDLYHFSFLGKTGSFIRNIDGSFTVFHASTYNGAFKIEKENDDTYESKGAASQFIITTDDEYKYYFGDIEDRDAISTERSGSSGKNDSGHLTIIAWKLMKIIAPDGREVDFVYGEGPMEIQNYTPPSWYNLQSGSGQLLSTSLSSVTTSCLSEINIDGGESLRFMYSSKPSGKTGKYISGSGLLDINGTSPLLTNIICSNTEAELDYTYNLRGSPNPFLKNVSIKGIGNYSMDYYGLEDGYFPPNGTVATDHWGYANKSNEYLCNQNRVSMSSISTVNSSTYVETLTGTRKEPDYYISLLGIMTRISYPTQGYSSFTYEPNIYYRRVSRESSDNFFPSPHVISGEGPGARIRRIANYDSDGTLSDSTSYRYIKSDGTSSGTLLKYPRYRVQYGVTVPGMPYLTANVSLATMGGLMSYDAVPVEYSRVEEILPDSSKAVYHFSGIDETDDIACNEYNQIGHLFEYSGQYYIAFASVPNVDRINHILAPESSMQSQRGKLIGKEVFKKDGTTPLQKSINNYNTQAELPYITEHYGVGEYAGDVPLYTGDYPLTSTQSTFYATDSVKQTSEFTYNNLGQKIKESKTKSNGDIIYTYYTYIPDIDSTQRTAVQKAMYKAHVIGYPVEATVKIKKSGQSGETVLSRDRYTFSEYSNSQGGKFYRPTKWEKLNVSTGALYTHADFLYDDEGDMIEKKDANGLYTSYIWGQGGLGVVILIENASNAAVREVPNCSGIFNGRVAEENVQSIADSIRTDLPFAQVTSYEYFRYGLPSKITDPSGKSTTYTYDDTERLTGIKDGKNENIEQYNYNSITK